MCLSTDSMHSINYWMHNIQKLTVIEALVFLLYFFNVVNNKDFRLDLLLCLPMCTSIRKLKREKRNLCWHSTIAGESTYIAAQR